MRWIKATVRIKTTEPLSICMTMTVSLVTVADLRFKREGVLVVSKFSFCLGLKQYSPQQVFGLRIAQGLVETRDLVKTKPRVINISRFRTSNLLQTPRTGKAKA